ncbi:MAG TPA: peptidoglycan editing factor PgeF [Polyangiales bacterium]|nr:peptidoglycan editing factor PgeF [Polyangiales bacterium]
MADVLRSALLERSGVVHGFNLRTGGVSEGAFASLNLGRSVGDEPEHVAENLRRFALATGYGQSALFETSQVHGAGVQAVSAGDDPVAVRRLEADALVAPAGGLAIAVRVADCVPVLLFAADSGAVAAVHAGWRGVARGVVEAGVRALIQIGEDAPQRLSAALFPHIGRCCFEVGEDVAEQLAALHPEPAAVVDRTHSKPHVDLAAIVRAKLQALGLREESIERVAGCTRCEPERFFSFRRDGQRSGRHVAAIVSR